MRLGGGIFVIDTDGPDGEAVLAQWGLSSPQTCITSRGRHAYFRTEIALTNVVKCVIDGVKTQLDALANGITVLPPTVITKTSYRYRWENGIVRHQDLPLFPTVLLKEVIAQNKKRPEVNPKIELPIPEDARIEGMRRWIRKVESVAGSSGDRAAFRVAVKVVSVIRDEGRALAEIMAWNNEGCARPPWTEAELRWKIACALKYQRGAS
jgi:hypothetical protein